MTKRKRQIKYKKEIEDYAETASSSLIKRLRKAAHPPGKKGSWLKHLTDSRLVEVYYMLEKHVAAYSIAQTAQREWEVMPNSQPQSLARAIRDFKKRAFTDIQLARLDADREEKKKLNYLEMKAENIVDKVDALQVKAWAVVAQQKRIMILLEKEDKTGVPFKFTDRSMRVLNELTTSLIKWQVELGMRPHAPHEINVQMKHEFAGLMAHTVGDDREKIYSASMKFIEEIDKRSLTLRQNPDGSYAYQPKKGGSKNGA